jgi:hypothetical protein
MAPPRGARGPRTYFTHRQHREVHFAHGFRAAAGIFYQAKLFERRVGDFSGGLVCDIGDLRSGGRLYCGGFDRNLLRRGVGAAAKGLKLGSWALSLVLLPRGLGLSGHLGCLGRRCLGAF